jgi:dephospho-CoA kinase
MKKIIGFCGVIGSGKDYNADKHVREGYVKVNFADVLKKIVFKMLKIENNFNYEVFKETYWNPVYKNLTSLNGRDFLQLGNIMRNVVDENIWINSWEKEVQKHDKIVTSDVRYNNEAKKIISLGGEIYFCNYKSNFKYNSKIKLESEQLSQSLLNKGFKDGDNLTEFFTKLNDQIF